MNLRWISLALLAALPSMTGYAQSEPAPASETVASVHWLGKNRIATDTNATALMGVWNLPESARLENRILDKLSAAPWVLLHRPADTNAAVLLRLLLDDLVQQESYLEIRQPGREPGQLLFAIRLDDARAARWETNLAAALESLTGIRPTASGGTNHGWSLKKHHVPNLIEWTRADGWLVLGAAQDHNAPLVDLLARIRRGSVPFAAKGTNFWLDADIDLRRVAAAFSLGWNLPAEFPRISLAEAGVGTNVWTHGRLAFSRPLSPLLASWNIPTELIDQNLTSFTVIRGFQPWLASQRAWTNLEIGPPPNQLCLWALRYQPMQTYFAAPLADASNVVERLTKIVLARSQQWFPSSDLGGFRKAADADGFEWNGLPYLWPYLQSITTSNGPFVFGGTFGSLQMEPLSLVAYSNVLGQASLIYYDRETTARRMGQWLFMGQFARHVLGKAQMSVRSAGLPWLAAITGKLGESVTEMRLAAPNEISFDRKSTLGFTAVELHLLADWMESPRFPIGLNTFLGPPGSGTEPPVSAPARAK